MGGGSGWCPSGRWATTRVPRRSTTPPNRRPDQPRSPWDPTGWLGNHWRPRGSPRRPRTRRPGPGTEPLGPEWLLSNHWRPRGSPRRPRTPSPRTRHGAPGSRMVGRQPRASHWLASPPVEARLGGPARSGWGPAWLVGNRWRPAGGVAARIGSPRRGAGSGWCRSGCPPTFPAPRARAGCRRRGVAAEDVCDQGGSVGRGRAASQGRSRSAKRAGCSMWAVWPAAGTRAARALAPIAAAVRSAMAA